MMNYEIFKDVVTGKILDYLPEQYRKMELKVHPFYKVNQIMDAITIIGDNIRTSPAIYINEMYENYLKSDNLQSVLEEASRKVEQGMKEASDTAPLVDLNTAKDNIVFQLIHTGQNMQLLSDVPNRAFQDLSVIYRLIIKTDEEGMQSAIIHNSLAEQLDLSEEEMFKLAYDNMGRLLPPTVKSMNDVIRELCIRQGMPAENVDILIGEGLSEQAMWVISNERGINGAAAMLYEDKLHELAESLGSDLYILPSSIHEVIAVSANMGDPYELSQMVAEINMEQVELNERLSNQVYRYDKDVRKILLATDTSEKSLDGTAKL